MNETKTYIVPDGNNNDLATTMAMMNNNSMNNGMWNNPFCYLVWLLAMRWMGNGWGNENGNIQTSQQLQTLQEQLQDNQNSNLIMQAIQGNNSALQDFATRTGCNFNAIESAVAGVRSAICEVGSQVGFSSERVINAVNVGDCGVIQALKDCCCTTQKSILEQGYQNQLANERLTYQITNSISSLGDAVDKGFTTTQFQTQTQTCNLQNTIRDVNNANTQAILAKLGEMLTQALLDKITALREKNSEQAVVINNAQQTSTFAQMLNSATSPIATAVNGLQKEVDSIKCALPQTVTLPANNSIAVPSCVAAQYGLFNNGFYNGYWG